MKFFNRILAVSLLALLSACATVPPGATSPSSVSQGTKPARVAPTPMAPTATTQGPQYPSGTLTPIATYESGPRAVIPLTPPADLWERIRRGFAMPDLEGELVQGREQWYAARPDALANMAERSRKYLFYIVEELERRNMPTELALLPFIESAFNPQALSHARAAGMWQFIPSTGKQFQLKQNAFRDDRRDVQASTRAALDYLEKLYRMFGDWHLALAAYNWGEGSVARAIAKNQRAGLGTRYAELSMPMETRYYVPKLQAMKNIVARPDNFKIKLPAIDNHPFFDTVTITRDIDLTLAAKLAEIPLDDFKALNPSIHRPVILAAGTPQILLPWDNADLFQRNLDAYVGSPLSSWTVWIAPRTMKAAEAANQVKMNEADLRAVNNIPANMLIQAGSTLLVPRPANLERDVTEGVADNGQISLSPEMVLRRFVIKAGKKETVATVAHHYNLPPAKVAEWNKLGKSTSFKPGQPVVIYRLVAANAPVSAKVVTSAGHAAAKPVAAAQASANKRRTPTRVARR